MDCLGTFMMLWSALVFLCAAESMRAEGMSEESLWNDAILLTTHFVSGQEYRLEFANLPSFRLDNRTSLTIRVVPQLERTNMIFSFRKISNSRPFSAVWRSRVVLHEKEQGEGQAGLSGVSEDLWMPRRMGPSMYSVEIGYHSLSPECESSAAQGENDEPPCFGPVLAKFTAHVYGLVNVDFVWRTAELVGVREACFVRIPERTTCSTEARLGLISEWLRIPLPPPTADEQRVAEQKQQFMHVWLIDYNPSYLHIMRVELRYVLGTIDEFPTVAFVPASLENSAVVCANNPPSKIRKVPVKATVFLRSSISFAQTYCFMDVTFGKSRDWVPGTYKVILVMAEIQKDQLGLSFPFTEEDVKLVEGNSTSVATGDYTGAFGDFHIAARIGNAYHLLFMVSVVVGSETLLLLRHVTPVFPLRVSKLVDEFHAVYASPSVVGMYLTKIDDACLLTPPSSAVSMVRRALTKKPALSSAHVNLTQEEEEALLSEKTLPSFYFKASTSSHAVLKEKRQLCLLVNGSFWIHGHQLSGAFSSSSVRANLSINLTGADPRIPLSSLPEDSNTNVKFTHLSVGIFRHVSPIDFETVAGLDVRFVLLAEGPSEVTVLLYGTNVPTEKRKFFAQSRLSLERMPLEAHPSFVFKMRSRKFLLCGTNESTPRTLTLSQQSATELAKKMQRNGVGFPPLATSLPYPMWVVRVQQPGEYAICASLLGVVEFVGVVPVPGPRFVSKVHPVSGLSVLPLPRPLIMQARTCARLAVSYSVAEGSRSELLMGSVLFLPLIPGQAPSCNISLRRPVTLVKKPLFYEEVHHLPHGSTIDRIVTSGVTFLFPGDYTICFQRSRDPQLATPDRLKEAFLETLLKGSARAKKWPADCDRAGAGGGDSCSGVMTTGDDHSAAVWMREGIEKDEESPVYLVLGCNKTNKPHAPSPEDMTTPTVIHVRWARQPELVAVASHNDGNQISVEIRMPSLFCTRRRSSFEWGVTCGLDNPASFEGADRVALRPSSVNSGQTYRILLPASAYHKCSNVTYRQGPETAVPGSSCSSTQVVHHSKYHLQLQIRDVNGVDHLVSTLPWVDLPNPKSENAAIAAAQSGAADDEEEKLEKTAMESSLSSSAPLSTMPSAIEADDSDVPPGFGD
jgi:hypothetical protein